MNKEEMKIKAKDYGLELFSDMEFGVEVLEIYAKPKTLWERLCKQGEYLGVAYGNGYFIFDDAKNIAPNIRAFIDAIKLKKDITPT